MLVKVGDNYGQNNVSLGSKKKVKDKYQSKMEIY